MIDLNSRSFISSADFSVPMGPDAKKLLLPKSVDDAAQAVAPAPQSTLTSPVAPLETTPEPIQEKPNQLPE
jgi:hypothetical protein